MARKHREGSGTFACDRCGATFPRDRSLKRHVEARHSAKAVAGKAAKLAGVAVLVVVASAVAYLVATAPPAAAPGLNLDDEPRMGSDDAPVVFVMFEDPNCPFCKRFHDQSLDRIIQEYVEGGQVQLYFKQNSGGNPWTLEGNIALECAYRHGGDAPFWRLVEGFYDNQDAVSAQPGGPKEKVRAFAVPWADRAEDLDGAAFAACYDNAETLGEVSADYADARALGARGTPAFIVKPRHGGEPVLISGAQPYAVFERNLNQALLQAAALGTGAGRGNATA